MKTHYDNLKIKRNASMEEVKAAYRSLAQKWHPDKHDNKKLAGRNFKIIGDAYYVLSDDQRRRMYDTKLMLEEMDKPETPPATTRQEERNNTPAPASSRPTSEINMNKKNKQQEKKQNEKIPFLYLTLFFTAAFMLSIYVLTPIFVVASKLNRPWSVLVVLSCTAIICSILYLALMYWHSRQNNHDLTVKNLFTMTDQTLKPLGADITWRAMTSFSIAAVITSMVVYAFGISTLA